MMGKLFPPQQQEANGDNESTQPPPSDDVPREVSTTTTAPAPRNRSHAILPWGMQITRPLAGMCCQECGTDWPVQGGGLNSLNVDHVRSQANVDTGEVQENVEEKYNQIYSNWQSNHDFASRNPAISPHAVAPMMLTTPQATATVQFIMQEYISVCQLYGTEPNSGVMTTLRFSLPAMRVAGPFHDSDMLALVEILVRHVNTSLNHIRRLDFSRASKEGGGGRVRIGFRSHGALALAKVLQISQNVKQVKLQRHRIGHYGATALFMAASKNTSLEMLNMRRCRIGERGAVAFSEIVCSSATCGLREVDLSANQIGFQGCMAVEKALSERISGECMNVDLEGNLVFQEVMNGITHGLGVLLAVLGSMLLSKRVEGKPSNYSVSCAIYSSSLLLLYMSSTLYHSFFTMQNTKYIFEALDKCAIYLLIAGSYTPFLQIVLHDKIHWSCYLLTFIWTCCICGIYVEASLPDWKHKKVFSLLMYLGMGWSALVCLPDLFGILPQAAIHLLVLGGVGYTSGVPFFVRNNNLDHSIWHLFVLAGSIFHWLGIYLYVATMEPTEEEMEACMADTA